MKQRRNGMVIRKAFCSFIKILWWKIKYGKRLETGIIQGFQRVQLEIDNEATVRLGAKRYPNEFLDAFLELTRGYWFWDDFSWAENLGYGTEERYGVLFTYTSSEIGGYGSIEHESKFPAFEKILEEIVSGNCFNNWPVISIIFHGSFYSWCLFLLMIFCLYRKRLHCFQMSLLLFLYFGTMLLGPVVQVRYLFPVMVILPILTALFSSQAADGAMAEGLPAATDTNTKTEVA